MTSFRKWKIPYLGNVFTTYNAPLTSDGDPMFCFGKQQYKLLGMRNSKPLISNLIASFASPNRLYWKYFQLPTIIDGRMLFYRLNWTLQVYKLPTSIILMHILSDYWLVMFIKRRTLIYWVIGLAWLRTRFYIVHV